MTLLIILLAIFAGVALMVILTEKFGEPMDADKQQKLSKIAVILIFVLLFAALIKQWM